MTSNTNERNEPMDDQKDKETPRLSPSKQLLHFFEFAHLPPHLQPVSAAAWDLACKMEAMLPDCAEKTVGLRKLLEAKDCFVRAALEK